MIKTQIIIPAFASLALFAAIPASANPTDAIALQKVQIGLSTGGISPSDPRYACRQFQSYPARQRCRQIHGIPENS
jgi:hypothetical protein